MAFIQLKRCLKDPKQFIKLVVLVICICVTIYQLSECITKLVHPPISTYYRFLLNDTIKYPSVTVCRKPAYKTALFPKYGMKENTKLSDQKAFVNFPFNKYSIANFLAEVTYTLQQTIPLYGYKEMGFNPDVEITKTYLLNNGLCHTFNPKINSDFFSAAGGFFFYFVHDVSLNAKVKNAFGISTSGFDVYMHHENEILTGEEEQENSLTEYVYLESSEDMSVNLKLQTFSQIPTQNDPCITTKGYSKSSCEEMCIHKQISGNVGCLLPWLRVTNSSLPQCSDYASVRTVIANLHYLKRKSYLVNCHCKMPCEIPVYSSSIQSRRDADVSQAPGSSTLNIYFPSNLITQMEEIISYDWTIFLSDIGGSLGFLLGLSVIGIINIIEQVFHMIVARTKSKKAEAGGKEEGGAKGTAGDQMKNDGLMKGKSLQSLREFLAELKEEKDSQESSKSTTMEKY